MDDKQLNIGSGHELDQILVHNISNKDFTTLWGGNPHTIESGKSRVMLRHIAVKFARELSHRIITAKADRAKVPITNYMPEKLSLINKILIKVQDEYEVKAVSNPQQLTEQEVNSAQDLGAIDVLEEYGIPVKRVRESADDIKENFRQMTPQEKALADAQVKDEEIEGHDDIGIIDEKENVSSLATGDTNNTNGTSRNKR